MRRFLHSLRPALPYLLVFLLAVAARAIPGARTIDDAFITYRYARNILAGNGFVYNPGEQVLGTTTPLYTLVMVVLGALSGGSAAPFPQLAMGLNAIADGVTAVLLLRLGKQLGARLAGWGAALVWAILPFSVTFAIGGLETSVYVLLLVATWGAYLQGRYVIVGLCAGLALLTRPDALILILPLGFDRLFFDQKRRGVRVSAEELLAFFAPTAIWFAAASFYFGSPLPHSIIAKQAAYLLEPMSALTRLLQHYATPFMGHLTFGIPWIGVGLLLYPFLSLVASRQLFKENKAIWPFLLFPWLYFTAFAIANPLIFRWYLTPPLPFYITLILIGGEHLLSRLLRDDTNGWRVRAVTIFLVVVTPTVLALRDWRLRPEHGLQRPAPEMAWTKLEDLYRQAADRLAPEMEGRSLPPVLATGDVGVLGYYTPARILDTVGLNSPEAVGYYPLPQEVVTEISYAVPAELILDQQPDYVVILEAYGRFTLLEDARFAAQYRLFGKIPTDMYGSEGMLIFGRVDRQQKGP